MKGKGSLSSVSQIHTLRHFCMLISFSLAISQALLEVLLSCMFIGTQNSIKTKDLHVFISQAEFYLFWRES